MGVVRDVKTGGGGPVMPLDVSLVIVVLDHVPFNMSFLCLFLAFPRNLCFFFFRRDEFEVQILVTAIDQE